MKCGDWMDAEKKLRIISEGQENGVSATCIKYGISRTLYYRWLNRYKAFGFDGLYPIKKTFVPVNKTPTQTVDSVLMLIKRYPAYGPREIKYLLEEIGLIISESAVYNIMKREGLSTKEKRLRYSKKRIASVQNKLPLFDAMTSGECWLFWTTCYGHHQHYGTLYEYTILDYKSKIACSRLYDRLSDECFEDLLTAVAIPVAQSLSFKTKYLCSFEAFNIQSILQSSGLDATLHLLKEEDLRSEIIEIKKAFTQHCLSYLMPFIHSNRSISEVKLLLQRHIRNYNLNHKLTYGDLECSPIEYHSIATGTNRILPLWAYIDRLY
ncbi:MAG TPA: hypothetical protein DCS67_08000 [Clostridiales bacterium UBA8960]|jgi:transposase|nr:hypothetical protein [Clostridiales bacterium UBA8960]